jgi:hypothetical protein
MSLKLLIASSSFMDPPGGGGRSPKGKVRPPCAGPSPSIPSWGRRTTTRLLFYSLLRAPVCHYCLVEGTLGSSPNCINVDSKPNICWFKTKHFAIQNQTFGAHFRHLFCSCPGRKGRIIRVTASFWGPTPQTSRTIWWVPSHVLIFSRGTIFLCDKTQSGRWRDVVQHDTQK